MIRTGYQIRAASPVDASAIAHVYVATWRTSYRNLLPAATLSNMNEMRETLYWWTALCSARASTVTLVVENPEGRVVGFVSGGPDRDQGAARRAEIYTLYLLQDMQRRGFGAALLSACAARLAALGFNSLVVWVLAANSARGFYESFGGIAAASKTIRVGDRRVEEVAYLWADIRSAARAVADSGDGVGDT